MTTIFKTAMILMLATAIEALYADYWSGYVDVKTTYTVGSGETLEIEPGTVVRFDIDAKLIVDGGTLRALGTN
jgi:hypothetical protein